ncbi:hypothetical protein C8C83_0780 [Flavobacterium sp. 90]|uniref:hypothetical protein n=1 Tax=unclassified Flavobacterium TaxID=196869 RepID=UPI000EB3BD07|nr:MULTISPECIES: hypothetical protein [unclassified Flavobacterium]RKR09164.1 hypothetical protein C8C82_1079 [Flavobacterium sp. 81]TCK52948.1 hypothetical protein C8C83_0780 [Flavobacterium sp. 90]
MSTLLIITILISFICYQIYFEKVITKKVPIQRKEKIFKLLSTKFEGLKENHLGFFEFTLNNKNILFDYKAIRHKNGFSNILKIYLDISTIEEEIKQLCKIHFYCIKIDNKDWIEMPVEVFFDSLNNLVKYSSKTVDRIISETEIYISEKRRERDTK